MKKCFDGHRYFYNLAVQEINSRYEKRKQEFEKHPTCIHCKGPKEEGKYTCQKHKNKKIDWTLNIRADYIREAVMKNDSELTEDEKWQAEIPYATRDGGIRQAVSAYFSTVANRMKGNISHFKLQFSSRKNKRQIFWIAKTALKIKDDKVRLFVRRLCSDSELIIKNRDRRHLPTENMTDCKILYDGVKYYLVLTIKTNIVEKIEGKKSEIALDPGVRTFQTGFCPEGLAFKFGENQAEQIKYIHNRIDKLNSVLTEKIKSRTKRNIKKRLAKLNRKITLIADNLHNQCGSLLAKNFNTVILPEFGTSKMQVSDNLCSTVKRRMNSLSHYRFQQKLSYLCQKHGSKLVIVDESYTTKTCGMCGFIKDNVGSDKTYRCDQCNYQMDRDIHGARNIWLKSSAAPTAGCGSHPLNTSLSP
jgi:putative transposase